MYCNQCGQKCSDYMKFCTKCGNALVTPNVAEPKKKSKKKFIILGSVLGILLIAAGVVATVFMMNHKKSLQSLKDKVAEIETFHSDSSFGMFEEEYLNLLDECNLAIKDKKYGNMADLMTQIDSFTENVENAQTEASQLLQKLKEYQNISEQYRIPLKDQEDYERLCNSMEEQLQTLNIAQAKESETSIETMIQSIKDINEEFTFYINQYKYYQTAFEEYVLSDDEKAAYENYLATYNEAIEELDLDACKMADQEIKNYETKIAKESIDNLQDKEKKLKEALKQNRQLLCKAELEEVKKSQGEIQLLINEKKYHSAYTQYESLNLRMNQYVYKAYGLDLTQVDLSEYPIVKLYLNMYDSYGGSISNINYSKFMIKEKMKTNSNYVEQNVLKASILDGMENLNVNLVADVSASMGYQFYDVMSIMKNFLNTMQFNIGDKASLISFSDAVNSEIAFTSNYTDLVNTIDRLYMGNMTALYDALYIAILQTAQQSGAKCIMAFTDGNDNISSCTKEMVIELAKRYQIPIYMIGIGSSIDENSLNLICQSTGGYYTNIYNVWDMQSIYSDIFRKQKDLYYLEYKTSLPKEQLEDVLSIYIKYEEDNMVATTESEFVPEILLEAVTSHAYDVDGYIFWDSDARYLTAADLEGLTAEELRLARNEIYARRGRKFKDDYLQEYFNSKSWYHGTIKAEDFNENYFNDYEKANAYFIADFERLHGFIK